MRTSHRKEACLRLRTSIAAILAGFALALGGALPIWAQSSGPMARPAAANAGFRAVHYDVSATLDPAHQMLTARAVVDFEATGASRVIVAELHPNLRISSVTDGAGRTVSFQRDDNPLGVRVELAQPVPAGQKITLIFTYAGPLSNEENSPVPGVRLASITVDGAYLLLPSRWFPLTGYPTNRYTGVFKIQVPGNFAVAGTGQSGPVQTLAGSAALPAVVKPGAPPPPPMEQKVYTFKNDRPEPAGSFVANVFDTRVVGTSGLKLPLFTLTASSQTAQLYGDFAGKIITTFSDDFGALPDPNITIAEMPDGSVSGYAGPGLVLVSQRQWDPKGNTRLLSRLIAAQWFGNEVLPASRADVWATDGLARYCEALYAEQDAGKEAANRAVDDFSVGALMYEDAAPVAQADHLQPFTAQYLSVVQDKGAAIFNMLRGLMGADAFNSLLRDFYARYAGKNASDMDMEQMAQTHFAHRTQTTGSDGAAEGAGVQSLTPFFAQWLDSTGTPQFSLEYTVFRNPKGFRVVGKVKQNMDTFNMPVELEVETEGNPEYKIIDVVGTESSFTVDTFGRPKPGGIHLDPHNYILKSSGNLKVRAVVAKGETLAEQGKFFEAVQEYQHALDLEANNALALFRMGEAFFYQRNYAAAANSFRGAIGGTTDLSSKWVEVWGHIYMGKIYDVTGQRDRAVNEYNQAMRLKDDTDGAQAEAQKYLSQAYKEGM
jgi:hypothetical protein